MKLRIKTPPMRCARFISIFWPFTIGQASLYIVPSWRTKLPFGPLVEGKTCPQSGDRRDFHVRAFGEELTRVNLDMTMKKRLQYIDWMPEMARKNGVPSARRRLEEEESYKLHNEFLYM